MSKCVKPLTVVAALVFALGFSKNVFAVSADEAAQILLDAALSVVVEVTEAVYSDSSLIGPHSDVVSALVAGDNASLVSKRSPSLLLNPLNKVSGNSVKLGLLNDAIAANGPVIDEINGVFYLAAPLPANLLPGCASCHTDFAGLGSSITGAVVIQVPAD